uniref:Toxoplasma gondii family B protein n=1 Tax=Toxoplasma gondii COUG TaxID=1074873 RepID=A0A2G8Y2J9_TOXGO|nr:Toxoplasma gondii family B protein [Toxoplasma gondii COUG]
MMHMMRYSSSAATLAFFVLLLCDMQSRSIWSWAMTQESLDTSPVTNSGFAADHAPSGTAPLATPSETDQQRTRVPLILKRSKRASPTEKSTALLRRTKTLTAAKVALFLTAVAALLLASAKLHQCRNQLLKDIGREAEGNTGRRLAAGGGDDEKCGSGAMARTGVESDTGFLGDITPVDRQA